VALLSEQGDYLERSIQTDRRHAEVLPGLLDAILEEACATWPQIELIAVSIGPGSFTGLRVGLSFAKGLAVGIGCPIAPVDTLYALAEQFYRNQSIVREHSGRFSLCPLVPARKAEAFGQLYKADDKGIVIDEEPMLVDRAKAEELMGQGVMLFGEGGKLLWLSSEETSNFIGDFNASAMTIAQLGRKQWLLNPASLQPASSLEPRYLKEFTVTVKKQTL